MKTWITLASSGMVYSHATHCTLCHQPIDPHEAVYSILRMDHNRTWTAVAQCQECATRRQERV